MCARRTSPAASCEFTAPVRSSAIAPSSHDVWQVPLHVAAYHGRVEEVAVLLAAGANVDEDANGDTPLLIACEQGHDEVVLRMITKASVNLYNKAGNSPLVVACEKGHAECVAKLLDANASVNQQDAHKGVTPLIAAGAGRET